MLTQERLKELLNYDHDTGLFTHKVSRNGAKEGDIAGHIKTNKYKEISCDGKRYCAHRLAWLFVYGTWPQDHIDHINGNPSDNRISNLRDVTNIVNQQNQKCAHRNNKVGLLGVLLHKKSGKYMAQIRSDGKIIYLGLFDIAMDAHNAYLVAKRNLHIGGTI